jgi:hypothetical protein
VGTVDVARSTAAVGVSDVLEALAISGGIAAGWVGFRTGLIGFVVLKAGGRPEEISHATAQAAAATFPSAMLVFVVSLAVYVLDKA